ncbi:MAG: protein kinase [Elusimicrobiota bacterium]
MATVKILLVVADESLRRALASALTGRDFELRFVAGAGEAIGESGWPFKATEAAVMIVDLTAVDSAEAQGLVAVHKEKKFSLIFLRPASALSPARPGPLRSLSWPLPPGFGAGMRGVGHPVVFLVDRTLHLAKALPAALKEAGVDCAVLDSPQALPDFLRAQPKAGPEAPAGLMARFLGRKPAASAPGSAHVADVEFSGDLAEAEVWDQKIRKTAPQAVCYRLTSEDPALEAVRCLRQNVPLFLIREQPKMVAAVLESLSSSPGESAGGRIPILLMDHDPEVLSSMARPLLTAGYRVELARDPAEALKLVARKGDFHAAILGMTFAYSFGYAKDAVTELSSKLRQTDPDLRVIFIIDVYPLERALREMSRALEVGADDALLKPPEVPRLIASLERALGRRSLMMRAGAAEPGGIAPPAAAAASSESLVAGRYDLVFQVGEGGMGIVYLASDRKLGRKVALKRMRAELKVRADQRQKFIEEAQIISHLSHPYIVGVHEIVEDGSEIYLVLDYVEGMPLSQIITERRRLSFAESRNILGCLCQAIDYAHTRKVLHRDLKPANIMIDRSGFVKVMDFGLAWEMKATVSLLTQSETAGTLAYMAPEQHLGRCGKSSDIYALGVCLYEMLTGQLPFNGPDFLSQKERMLFVPPNLVYPELPAALAGLLSRVLAPDPRQRIASAAELHDCLTRLPGAVAEK